MVLYALYSHHCRAVPSRVRATLVLRRIATPTPYDTGLTRFLIEGLRILTMRWKSRQKERGVATDSETCA